MNKIVFKKTYKKITIVHHVDIDNDLWGTSGRRILRKSSDGDWEKISSFPFSKPRDYFAFPRPVARAARADKCNIYVNKKENILGIRGSNVYKIRINESPKFLFSINGDSVLNGGICEDIEGNIYFGEYYMNPARKAVNIWKISSNLDAWEAIYSFPANSIRHIHGVYSDPYYPNVFWITTGDFENECYIYRTEDNFQNFDRYGDGTQIWRAVKIFFSTTHISWLTDSNLEQNYACRFDRYSGNLEKGQKIDASAWYGHQTSEGEFIAFTTVEPGPGIKTNDSYILYSQDGFTWGKIYSFQKDFWRPMKLFKYGVISCPSGVYDLDNFYISGEGLKRLDGISYNISLQKTS